MQKLTPLQLELLLHYHTGAGDHPRIYIDTVRNQALRLIQDRLLKNQILAPGDTESLRIAITDRGKAHVEALLQVPFPERGHWRTPWERMAGDQPSGGERQEGNIVPR